MQKRKKKDFNNYIYLSICETKYILKYHIPAVKVTVKYILHTVL